MKSKAFTLIELLVVIAIISLLFAIIIPALNLAKQKAGTTVCLSNTKNLSLGWFMYAGDNDSRIMSSEDTGTEPGGRFVGWCGVPRDAGGNTMGNTQADPPVTDEDEIRGIKLGVLFSYIKEPKAYHCPSDTTRKSLYDQTRVFVTYSVPMCLYGHPGDAGYATEIRRYSQITQPSTRYVFVESGETRNWNASHHFVIGAPEYTNLATWGWWGVMAINHGNSSILGFCDGHSEVHKWRDKFTIERMDKLIKQGGGNYGVEYPPADQTEDINYIAKGWAYRHKIGK
jgi:prepilin-type N-terminal cleavage/methylation domain-containing protein/prepilin-type processing-associated H-X9-DG protein